jgi:hypothetical protein
VKYISSITCISLALCVFMGFGMEPEGQRGAGKRTPYISAGYSLTEVDKKLFCAADSGSLEEVQQMLAQDANVFALQRRSFVHGPAYAIMAESEKLFYPLALAALRSDDRIFNLILFTMLERDHALALQAIPVIARHITLWLENKIYDGYPQRAYLVRAQRVLNALLSASSRVNEIANAFSSSPRPVNWLELLPPELRQQLTFYLFYHHIVAAEQPSQSRISWQAAQAAQAAFEQATSPSMLFFTLFLALALIVYET